MKIPCEYCGQMIPETEQTCPYCGAANKNVKRTAYGVPATMFMRIRPIIMTVPTGMNGILHMRNGAPRRRTPSWKKTMRITGNPEHGTPGGMREILRSLPGTASKNGKTTTGIMTGTTATAGTAVMTIGIPTGEKDASKIGNGESGFEWDGTCGTEGDSRLHCGGNGH